MDLSTEGLWHQNFENNREIIGSSIALSWSHINHQAALEAKVNMMTLGVQFTAAPAVCQGGITC